jgi:hypothetical protein
LYREVIMAAKRLWFILGLLLCVGVPVQPAHATIILEGSDAIGLHCGSGGTPPNPACIYRDQVWKAIGGADPRPIAVIGDVPSIGSTTHPVVDFTTVAAAGTLSNYVALYFVAGGGCCDENDSLITAPGAQAAVSAYLAAGGTVMIENYEGHAAWDFAVHTGGVGNAHVAGFGGALTGPGCTDAETVTALGLANGFTQPPVIGCWTHQAYQNSFFGPLGFNLSFFDSDPAFASSNPGTGTYSSLLSNGLTVVGVVTGGGTVPEPASLLLMGSGLVVLATWRLRKWGKPS